MRDRGGDFPGDDLEPYRAYLLMIAGREMDGELRAKAGPSDLVQETFLKARQHQDRLRDSNPDAVRAWLRKILLREISHHRRRYLGTERRRAGRERAIDEVPAPSHEETPSKDAIRREEAELLERCLARLDEGLRSLILMKNRDGMTFAAIAERLGTTEDAARKRWARAVRRLRRDMKAIDE